jgi:CheY-like chemotaxis protein
MNKAKVLVVDDDPKLSALTRMVLEKTQIYEVREVNRPMQALAVAREFRPDCVLLDVDMPGKNGGEVASDLAADRSLRDVPVMFFTSLISKTEAGEREILRGGKRYLAKPINPSVLLAAVGRLLGADSALAEY